MPVLIHRKDAERLAPLWLKWTELIRNDTEDGDLKWDPEWKKVSFSWTAEMFGYVFAACELGLRHDMWTDLQVARRRRWNSDTDRSTRLRRFRVKTPPICARTRRFTITRPCGALSLVVVLFEIKKVGSSSGQTITSGSSIRPTRRPTFPGRSTRSGTAIVRRSSTKPSSRACTMMTRTFSSLLCLSSLLSPRYAASRAIYGMPDDDFVWSGSKADKVLFDAVIAAH